MRHIAIVDSAAPLGSIGTTDFVGYTGLVFRVKEEGIAAILVFNKDDLVVHVETEGVSNEEE